MKTKIKIYSLYEIKSHGNVKFAGRFASFQKLKAAAMFMPLWFYEAEEKLDEFA
jgi:hypothetical protein